MAGTNNPLQIWLLSDGAPGHLSQSRGLADAIGRFVPVQVTVVDLKVRLRWLKSLGRKLLPLLGPLAPWLRRQVYAMALPSGQPDLLVSSGGNTLLASALLAQELAVPNLYSGTLKGYPHQHYSRIYSVTSLGVPNNLVLPLPPVPETLSKPLPAAPADAPWLLLIGGDGAGYRYAEADWRALAAAVNRLGQERGMRWLLTTSRRTGAAAEALLQRLLDPALLVEAVYYGQTPRPVVREFLARCGGVWVSEDSLTMVAEAIYSGRPVRSLRPQTVQPEANDALALASYAERGLLARSPLADLPEEELTGGPAAGAVPDVQRLIWESVQPLLPPGRLQ